jgi:hypothetical protein
MLVITMTDAVIKLVTKAEPLFLYQDLEPN